MAAEENIFKPESKKGGYDAVVRAQELARIVCEGDKRKYHRFRPARFYGASPWPTA